MRAAEIERNAEIVMMRKEGATYNEIAEWYDVSPQRAKQICGKFSDGNTKEEIIRNYERKKEERMERRMEDRRMADIRKGGRDYVVMNSAEDMYLTKIEQADNIPIYRYGSADVHDALWFTLAEAKEIQKRWKARVFWVPKFN